MVDFSALLLISSIVSLVAIVFSISIFNKVFQENYKKPWLFISISAIFFSISQILDFFNNSLAINIISTIFTDAIVYVLEFIAITILAYAILLEYFILKFYKGKFVKMKFIPVQEGSFAGKLDLDVSRGVSYLAVKKDKNFMYDQFSKAIGAGFEGFLITEDNPKITRTKYKIVKSPIAWLSQIEGSIDSQYLKDSLDENSDIVDPLQLNNLVSFIDNFLEQAENPMIMMDLNLLFKNNNSMIVLEFLRYISARINKFDGIFLALINSDIVGKSDIVEIQSFFKEIE